MYSLPLISIICPLYNKKSYIKETINSVINQTYKNWEMIIVDDGSTDGSFDFVEEVYKGNRCIRLYRRTDFKPNKGGSVCRNLGISLSKGAYIMFLDADDLLIKDCLSNRLRIAQNHARGDLFVFNEAYFINNPDQPFIKRAHHVIHKVMFSLSSNKVSYFLKRFLKYDLPWTISNTFWRAEFLKTLSGFNEKLPRLQDPDLHIKALFSNEIQLYCFKYNVDPDVLIRVEPERHAGIFLNNEDKFNQLYESVTLLIDDVTSLLNNRNKKLYFKYLSGYLFKLQVDLQYFQKFTQNPINFSEEKLIGYASRIGFKATGKNNYWIKLHKIALYSKLLSKLKVPALIYTLFMNCGFYKVEHDRL